MPLVATELEEQLNDIPKKSESKSLSSEEYNREISKSITEHIKRANINISGEIILTKIELDKLIDGSQSELKLPVTNINVTIA